jgi:hypothetical protein
MSRHRGRSKTPNSRNGEKATRQALALIELVRRRKDRATFEQWLVTIRGERPDIKLDAREQYVHSDTQALYSAWVAGAYSPYRPSRRWVPE